MSVPKVHVIDFETEGIQQRPHFPPRPVGVSIRRAGERRSKYYAWGHPTGNNCTKEEAVRALRQVWEDSHTPILAHNAKFEYAVATEVLGLPEIPWERIHDTQYLLFLYNPHAKTLSLKPAAEEILGLPPEEQDAVRDWLIEQKIVRKNDKNWGRYICLAPGDLVGKYAEGDTDRTLLLFRKLYPIIQQEGMLPAYDRERELMPYLLQSERDGMRVDLPALERDVPACDRALERIEAWIRQRIGAPEDFNLDDKEELAEYLDRCGAVKEWVYTKTGKRSTSKENLTSERFADKVLANALDYRGRMKTVLNTFLKPWLAQARETGGRIHTTWNQVRQEGHRRGAEFAGTRTGRISSENPNFANIPSEFEVEVPTVVRGLPPIPFARRYILPNEGETFVSMDYSQQELRILAHYIEGPFMQAYIDNPHTDAHEWVGKMLRETTGKEFSRKVVKASNFLDIYGGGAKLLAKKTGMTLEEAIALRAAKRRLMVGLEELEEELKLRGRIGMPIRTWGGRVYYCEEPRYSAEHNKYMTFEYKLLNYLIQGSAADCTKEAIIRYMRVRKDGMFLSQVYDEINISVPGKALASEIRLLREAAESVEFDVPMLTDVEIGPNWHDLKPYQERMAA